MVAEIWQNKKVCIIEDDADIRDIYKTKFSADGFEVLLAEDGEKGIALVREKKPDIILLDLQMPVKDGYAVLEDLNADPQLKRIPVIVLTNADNEQAYKDVGKYNTKFYLVKSLTTPQKAVDYVKEVLH